MQFSFLAYVLCKLTFLFLDSSDEALKYSDDCNRPKIQESGNTEIKENREKKGKAEKEVEFSGGGQNLKEEKEVEIHAYMHLT